MDAKHRNSLRSNRVELVRSVVPNEDLFSFLMMKNTLNDDMAEEIMHKPTRAQKVGGILDLLPRRGPHAFRAFVEGLVESDQGHVADILDKPMADRYRTQTNRPTEDTYPEGTPMPYNFKSAQQRKNTTVDDKSSFITFDIKTVNQRDGIDKNNDGANYSMKSKPRGQAIIINIDKFETGTKQKDRFGSEFDVVNLTELFTKLHFKVSLLQNLTGKEIRTEIEKERKAEHHKDFDAFIMVILSHGQQGKVFSKDGELIDVNTDIVNRFNGKHCLHLINKPKMFFIQACQVASSAQADGSDGDEDDDWLKKAQAEHKAKMKEDDGDTSDSIDASLKSITHEQADLFIAWATVPGFKAWRHTAMGSWFMRDLVKVFAEYCHMEHVADMMVRVNRLVNDRIEERTGSKQICRTETQLRRNVFLLPGYFN